jgi:radical SAM enzyme (TIGR01210 family)
MCGYHLGAHHGLVTDEHLVSQTQDAIRRLNPTVYPLLVFTSNGSFLDPAEVSDNVRPVLLRMLRAAGFRFLVTETRPEFITPRRLDAMVDAFTPTSRTATGYHPISISLGLESSNDFVRQYCINKGTRLTDYLEAFDILRRHRIHYDCYVLLGKLFVTAKEDVEDCVETIKFAVDNGADCVFVMVTNMVSYSLTSYLYGRGRYVLPSLWRAVELLERLPDQYRRAVQVKGVSHAPTPPRNYARTCDSCTEYVKGCLNFWNQTGEFEHIRSITECTCRDEFRSKEWAYTPSEALEQRVLAEYGRLAAELHVDPALIPSLSSMRRTARMGGGQ